MKLKLKLSGNQKILITCFLLAVLTSLQTKAQEAKIECRSDDAMKAYYKQYPEAAKEQLSLIKKLNVAQRSGNFKSSAAPYTIPVVFHVFGTTYNNGKTVNLAIIEGALREVNTNIKGLNPNFNTIDAPFNTIKATLDIQFKLAKIDPNGQATTGVVFYNQESGMGNPNNPRVPQVAWDNYKYCNIYITRDLYNNGVTNNTGVAWFPDTRMSDAGTARIVYNGSYLGTNKTSTQGSTLTHEVGHWLDLPHTFNRGICNNNPNDGDGVADTPSHRVHSGNANCQVIRNCLNQEINVENYMDYTSCEKMFTRGQVTRMTNALENSRARNVLWTEANLIATGVKTGTNDTQAPTVPTGLTASRITNTTVDLSWTASTDNVGVTGYEVYRDADSGGEQILGTTNPGETRATINNLIANTTYQFYLKAIDAAGNKSAFTRKLSVTTTNDTTNPTPTYCTAGKQGTNFIATVSFGSISNTSQNSTYTDYTAQRTTVQKGASITLTVTPRYAASNWSSNVVGGWIDWNQDGDFDDAGEEVLMKPRGTGIGTATVVVPNSAKNGTTRLRVRYRWFSNPSPCGATDGDEVEDYGVTVGGDTNPNPTCTDGIQNGDETGRDCGGSSCPPCQTNTNYCTAGNQGTNFITGVTFGSISNTSQNSAYTDYTSQSTTVTRGESIVLTVTPIYATSNWNNNVLGGWIDWNQDGDFDDAGEEVLMKPRGAGVGTATVVVPNNAKAGTTRLRVRYRWFRDPSPCGASDGDEVEDYTVSVSASKFANTGVSNLFSIAINPAKDRKLHLNFGASQAGNLQLEIYDATGRKVARLAKKKSSEQNISLPIELNKGFYIVKGILNGVSDTKSFIVK